MNLNGYCQFAQYLTEGAVVLATVIEAQGSTPREMGAKMAIIPDGRIFGTIGGGAGEAKVIQQAKHVLATGKKQWVEIDLTGAPQRETQGICGGTMQVWLERWSGEVAIALVQQILSILQAGQSATLITPLTAEQFPYLLREAQPIPKGAFVEVLQPLPLLLIVGAGHCGIQLAKVAHLIGFQIAIQDDRPEWANRQHYPQATWIFNQLIADTAAQLASHPHLYVALVTRGYQYDFAALDIFLRRALPCCYIGMMGSKKRVQQVQQAMANTNISRTQLQKIHAPIGLDIGALTPEEIAVSICAELIQIRRGETQYSLAAK